MTLAKLRISATLLVETGLHIGASNAFAAIGATDSPVIKDAVTNLPIIPGSSLKGKIRSLLSKTSYNTNTTKDLGNDSAIISRNFGNSKSKEYKIGRMLFRDAFLLNKDDLERRGVRTYTEVKFENTIDRITAEANPRQIERVIRDSEFGFELIYEVNHQSEQEIVEDMQLLRDGLLLLEMDYLGGSGSRGYGKVAFKDLTVDLVFGECDVERIQDLLTKEV